MKLVKTWKLLFFLQFILNIPSQSSQLASMKGKWRDECIYDFAIKIQEESLGILYNDESSFQKSDFLKSVTGKRISTAIYKFPVTNFRDLIRTVKFWKMEGVKHILFLQKMDTKLIYLWIQILKEMCDETWWIFLAEKKSKNLFERALTKTSCVTGRWTVLSVNCSTTPNRKASNNKSSKDEMLERLPDVKFRLGAKMLENFVEDPESSRKLIRLVVNESPPYLTVNVSENGEVVLVDGPDAELLNTMSEKFGFKYKIFVSPDGEWGRKRRGNWTGLVGMLTRGEADIASGCVTITYPRIFATKFSFPYDVQRSVIISRIPRENPKTYAVLLPFTYNVWLLIFFVLISVLILLFGIGKIYGTIYLRKHYKFDRIFWYMIGTMCSEGGWLTFKINGIAAAFLLALWLLFVLVMQASYTGTLMSVLTFPSFEPAIDTLYDLANAVAKNGYKCGCLKGTINCDTLMDLRGDLKVIGKSLSSDTRNFVRSVNAGLKKVLDGKFAFLAQQLGSIYHAQLMPEPDFYMSDEGLDIELFSLAIRKELPFLNDIDKMIIRLLEAGLIAKWRDDIISINNMNFDRRRHEVKSINPLSLSQITGALYMFSYGVLLAFFALAFECISGKCFNMCQMLNKAL